MRIVYCYDVTDDKRRRRLADRMERFLIRVQKSVFEGSVDRKRLERIRKISRKEIDPSTDSVRIYHLCAKCAEATEIIGVGVSIPTARDDEVV